MRVRTPVALLAAMVLAVACGDAPTGPDAAPTLPSAVDDTEPAVSEEPATDRVPAPPQHPEPPVRQPAPPVAPGYELVEGETAPAAKRAAAEFARALTTYEPGERPADVVARATDDAELADRLEAAAEPLLHDEAWSRGEIVYPQLGGIEPDESAVITVVRQRVGHPDGTTSDHTRVLDIRVERTADGSWRVSDLVSAGGAPVARPDRLSAEAAAVLDDERIELPDTARWDIHRGAVDDSLLRLMARMAERTPYGVVVFETGHSREVFGTTRISRHAEGRAVDIYRLGDELVIEDRADGSATHDLVRWLYEQPELSEVGSPWALDGYGGRSFSDELHQDHVHVGVLRPGEKPKQAQGG